MAKGLYNAQGIRVPSAYAPIRPQLVWIETCSKTSIRSLFVG
jgi:hypothetical protein